MLFNSISFAIFLPIVFILYWILPHKYRWVLLFIASYYFYMSWNIKYVVLIFLTTCISYITALLIEKTPNIKKKRLLLAIAAAVSLGILFFFKYFNFFQENVIAILSLFAIQLQPATLNLLLPVGISFYTFQTLSYVIDVYKGTVPAERHFGIYATFISFFPQLVAGPIERTPNLLPQIKKEHFFDYEKASYGMKLMTWGFFKKLAIADILAGYVDTVYNSPYSYHGFAFVLATFFFAIQIYCDFSGYSDIAIGTAKLFGIDLMTNFKSPYFSASIKEFWSRWHISLSTWFRDYVYIPLGGNRKGPLRAHINLIITFLVSGLWHGASRKFLVWGGIHGLAQVIEKTFIPQKGTKRTSLFWALRVIITFVFCSFAWIFFRANSLLEALFIITHLFDGIASPNAYIQNGLNAMKMTTTLPIGLILSILLLALYDFFSLKRDVIELISKQNVVLRYSFYCGILLFIILFKASVEASFVYFQF